LIDLRVCLPQTALDRRRAHAQNVELLALSSPTIFGDLQSVAMARLMESLLTVLARFTTGQLSNDFNAIASVHETVGPRACARAPGQR